MNIKYGRNILLQSLRQFIYCNFVYVISSRREGSPVDGTFNSWVVPLPMFPRKPLGVYFERHFLIKNVSLG